jgi:hypothetical protein
MGVIRRKTQEDMTFRGFFFLYGRDMTKYSLKFPVLQRKGKKGKFVPVLN